MGKSNKNPYGGVPARKLLRSLEDTSLRMPRCRGAAFQGDRFGWIACKSLAKHPYMGSGRGSPHSGLSFQFIVKVQICKEHF